ncbi:GntR family transcriptional regulator [Brevibacillus sp. B_LB10_24]|uniref:GntR family transcriptional regulator n=1 Tax=Brevibacillus sp. B_LB10_24 TaxID=3380645 RepID=UPI0038B6ED42
MNEINEENGFPLYYQLKELIKKKIDNGEWKQGDQLPNELHLAEEYQVSRSTVRQAILDLVREGVLYRKQGKGTFVSKPKVEGDLINFYFPTELGTKHDPIRLSEIPCPASTAKILEVNTDEPVYEIVRLRYFGNEPAAIETSYVPAVLAPGLLNYKLEGKLYDLLPQVYGLNISKAKNYIEPILLDRVEAKLLEVDRSQPALKMTRLGMSLQGKPVILTISKIRGDRVRMFIHSG